MSRVISAPGRHLSVLLRKRVTIALVAEALEIREVNSYQLQKIKIRQARATESKFRKTRANEVDTRIMPQKLKKLNRLKLKKFCQSRAAENN